MFLRDLAPEPQISTRRSASRLKFGRLGSAIKWCPGGPTRPEGATRPPGSPRIKMRPACHVRGQPQGPESKGAPGRGETLRAHHVVPKRGGSRLGSTVLPPPWRSPPLRTLGPSETRLGRGSSPATGPWQGGRARTNGSTRAGGLRGLVTNGRLGVGLAGQVKGPSPLWVALCGERGREGPRARAGADADVSLLPAPPRCPCATGARARTALRGAPRRANTPPRLRARPQEFAGPADAADAAAAAAASGAPHHPGFSHGGPSQCHRERVTEGEEGGAGALGSRPPKDPPRPLLLAEEGDGRRTIYSLKPKPHDVWRGEASSSGPGDKTPLRIPGMRHPRQLGDGRRCGKPGDSGGGNGQWPKNLRRRGKRQGEPPPRPSGRRRRRRRRGKDRVVVWYVLLDEDPDCVVGRAGESPRRRCLFEGLVVGPPPC